MGNYIRKLQVMVNDRGLQQTMAARQSRRLLREMTKGLWDFMSLLDLSESEVDPIIEHMLKFVKFANEIEPWFFEQVMRRLLWNSNLISHLLDKWILMFCG